MKGIRAELVTRTSLGSRGFSATELVNGAMGVRETAFFFGLEKRRTRGAHTHTIEAARATHSVVIPDLRAAHTARDLTWLNGVVTLRRTLEHGALLESNEGGFKFEQFGRNWRATGGSVAGATYRQRLFARRNDEDGSVYGARIDTE
jgi:hypothetical protein